MALQGFETLIIYPVCILDQHDSQLAAFSLELLCVSGQ